MSWELESGLPDNLTVTIEDARFTYDARYNNGESLLLEWVCSSDDPDNAELTLNFSCGSNWEAADGGRQATHPKKHAFVKTSRVGKMISRVMELGAGPVLEARGPMTDAQVWVGLQFHMARETADYGGEIGSREFLMPTAFVGTKDGKEKGTKTGTKVQPPAATNATPSAPSVSPAMEASSSASPTTPKINPKALKAVIQYAQQAATLEDWQVLCAGDEAILNEDSLLTAIYTDEGTGEGSLWAKYHRK